VTLYTLTMVLRMGTENHTESAKSQSVEHAALSRRTYSRPSLRGLRSRLSSSAAISAAFLLFYFAACTPFCPVRVKLTAMMSVFALHAEQLLIN